MKQIQASFCYTTKMMLIIVFAKTNFYGDPILNKINWLIRSTFNTLTKLTT